MIEKSLLARTDYVVEAPQQRVWDLLPATIIQCMPIEQMEILDDTSFLAVLRWKLGFIEVPFRLTVKVADMSPMDSLTTLVTASKGAFRSSLRVSFSLNELEEHRTAVVCTAHEDSVSKLMWLLKKYRQNFAGTMFDAIRKQLRRSC